MEKEVIYFQAQWCQGCETLTPTMDKIKKQIKVSNINVDYDSSLVEKYNIKSVPTVILLENGNEIRRFVGTKSELQIINWLNG